MVKDSLVSGTSTAAITPFTATICYGFAHGECRFLAARFNGDLGMRTLSSTFNCPHDLVGLLIFLRYGPVPEMPPPVLHASVIAEWCRLQWYSQSPVGLRESVNEHQKVGGEASCTLHARVGGEHDFTRHYIPFLQSFMIEHFLKPSLDYLDFAGRMGQ